MYPCMPGHGAVGRVTRAGGSVAWHKACDLRASAATIDSCRACAPCREQNHCEGSNSWLATLQRPHGAGQAHSTVMAAAEDVVIGIPAASRQRWRRDTVRGRHHPFVAVLQAERHPGGGGGAGAAGPVNNQERAMHRKSVAGSIIGSIAETREVLGFCAKHGIGPDAEVIPIQQINQAYEDVEKGEVRFRYVIDMASLRQELAA